MPFLTTVNGFIFSSVPDKGSLFSGKGKTSFPEKRVFSLPRTPTLFKKSGIFVKGAAFLPGDKIFLLTYPYVEQSRFNIKMNRAYF